MIALGPYRTPHDHCNSSVCSFRVEVSRTTQDALWTLSFSTILTNKVIQSRTDWNSGSSGIWAGTGSGRVPVDLAGTRPVTQCCIIVFMMSNLHHVPPPVPWLDHVHPSSSQTVSRATLQFPDCITCSPPVPWLYHVLPSSSQTVSRATL